MNKNWKKLGLDLTEAIIKSLIPILIEFSKGNYNNTIDKK